MTSLQPTSTGQPTKMSSVREADTYSSSGGTTTPGACSRLIRLDFVAPTLPQARGSARYRMPFGLSRVGLPDSNQPSDKPHRLNEKRRPLVIAVGGSVPSLRADRVPLAAQLDRADGELPGARQRIAEAQAGLPNTATGATLRASAREQPTLCCRSDPPKRTA